MRKLFCLCLFILLSGSLSQAQFSLVSDSCTIRQYHRTQEVYFSPTRLIDSLIIVKFDVAMQTIDLAMFSFTNKAIAMALIKAAQRGVIVRVVIDSSQGVQKYSVRQLLKDNLTHSYLLPGGKPGGIMHNKFAVIDSELVITGSYNWTIRAGKSNYENALFIQDRDFAEAYLSEFKIMYERARKNGRR